MTSPISATARAYVRARATEVMEYQCTIAKPSTPGDYDETSLAYTPPADPEIIYTGRCRIWEVASSSSVLVGDVDVYTQSTNLSIPWDTPQRIARYDEVTITKAPADSQMVGKRYQIETVAKAGELRATRRFEVTGIM